MQDKVEEFAQTMPMSLDGLKSKAQLLSSYGKRVLDEIDRRAGVLDDRASAADY
jgi:hypothetical protein